MHGRQNLERETRRKCKTAKKGGNQKTQHLVEAEEEQENDQDNDDDDNDAAGKEEDGDEIERLMNAWDKKYDGEYYEEASTEGKEEKKRKN